MWLADSGAIVAKADAWRYITKGIVKTIVPAKGQTGTRVAIGGSALRGGSNVVKVVMAGIEAKIATESDDKVEVIVQAGPAKEKTGDVVLTSKSGAILTEANAFQYLDAPVILAVTPDEGRTAAITNIIGNLCGGGTKIVEVYLAGVKALLRAADSDCKTVVVRASNLGTNKTGDVKLVSGVGSEVIRTNGFTYLADVKVDSVTPNQQGPGRQQARHSKGP